MSPKDNLLIKRGEWMHIFNIEAPCDLYVDDVIEPCFVVFEGTEIKCNTRPAIKRILRRKDDTGPYGVVWSREFGYGEMP